jgi:glucosamine--fructose-6-phosphate aminotransferase (isomerizing)
MYQSFLEIFNQNESLEKTFRYILDQKEELIQFFQINKPDEIVFIACGSSYWLSLSAAMTMTEKTGIRCIAVNALYKKKHP